MDVMGLLDHRELPGFRGHQGLLEGTDEMGTRGESDQLDHPGRRGLPERLEEDSRTHAGGGLTVLLHRVHLYSITGSQPGASTVTVEEGQTTSVL